MSVFVGFSVAAWVHATHQKTSAPTRVSRPQHAQQRFCLSTCYPAECGSVKDQDGQDFLKSGAKVVQKNEASKKIPEQVRFTRGDCSTFSNRRVDGYRIVKSQVVLRVMRKEDDIFFFELLGTNEVRSLIHFTKAFEEPSELVVF